jgi:hypothetical protein
VSPAAFAAMGVGSMAVGHLFFYVALKLTESVSPAKAVRQLLFFVIGVAFCALAVWLTWPLPEDVGRLHG